MNIICQLISLLNKFKLKETYYQSVTNKFIEKCKCNDFITLFEYFFKYYDSPFVKNIIDKYIYYQVNKFIVSCMSVSTSVSSSISILFLSVSHKIFYNHEFVKKILPAKYIKLIFSTYHKLCEYLKFLQTTINENKYIIFSKNAQEFFTNGISDINFFDINHLEIFSLMDKYKIDMPTDKFCLLDLRNDMLNENYYINYDLISLYAEKYENSIWSINGKSDESDKSDLFDALKLIQKINFDETLNKKRIVTTDVNADSIELSTCIKNNLLCIGFTNNFKNEKMNLILLHVKLYSSDGMTFEISNGKIVFEMNINSEVQFNMNELYYLPEYIGHVEIHLLTAK